MAMGKRKPRQESLFITIDQLTPSAGHPFYQRLNALLAQNGFDDWIERRCLEFYEHEETRGRPSLPPGVYFRMLLIGYFEGIDSQRGIAWRCSDSLSLRAFLGIPLDQATPDHSTLTNTRKRLPESVFDEVFRFVLGIAEANKLIAGTTVGVDSTLLEANAAMKTIVRKDTGDDWKQYVTKLMREAGEVGPNEEPSNEAARRFDRKRRGKKVSNEDWKSSTDADARIARMKDGTTHLAYKAEHVVDLESDLVLAAEVRLATDGDAATLAESVLAAQENLEQCGSDAVIEEVAADKGYHSGQSMETCADFEWRTYIPEPRRTHPLDLSKRSEAQRRAVLNNRRRTSRSKSKRMQKRRSEVVERTFAHVCETGGGRRSHLRGRVEVKKRYLLAVAAHNLGRILLKLTGVGKPRSLRGVVGSFFDRLRAIWGRRVVRGGRQREGTVDSIVGEAATLPEVARKNGTTSTGC
jgi:transposase